MKLRSGYHSPLRQAQAAATRSRILAACASLMESGGELTYSAVAQVADVQERTVYRHFATKADLQAGLWEWITSRLTHSDFSPATTDELVATMRRSFAGFDASAPLILSMLHSPQGQQVRLQQQPARRAMFRACVDAAVPGAPLALRERAAAALQVLYSAPSWELLRMFWGMDAGQAADTVELGIRSLLAGLAAAPPARAGPARRRRPASSAPEPGTSLQPRAAHRRRRANPRQERKPS